MKLINTGLEMVITALAFIFGQSFIFTYINNGYDWVYSLVWSVLLIIAYIVSGKYEKRLESELRDYEKYIVELDETINGLDSLVAERDNEIRLLKQAEVVIDELPFAEEVKPKEIIYTCPDCGEFMTRYTDKTAFCDNIICPRKRWSIKELKEEENENK